MAARSLWLTSLVTVWLSIPSGPNMKHSTMEWAVATPSLQPSTNTNLQQKHTWPCFWRLWLLYNDCLKVTAVLMNVPGLMEVKHQEMKPSQHSYSRLLQHASENSHLERHAVLSIAKSSFLCWGSY